MLNIVFEYLKAVARLLGFALELFILGNAFRKLIEVADLLLRVIATVSCISTGLSERNSKSMIAENS